MTKVGMEKTENIIAAQSHQLMVHAEVHPFSEKESLLSKKYSKHQEDLNYSENGIQTVVQAHITQNSDVRYYPTNVKGVDKFNSR